MNIPRYGGNSGHYSHHETHRASPRVDGASRFYVEDENPLSAAYSKLERLGMSRERAAEFLEQKFEDIDLQYSRLARNADLPPEQLHTKLWSLVSTLSDFEVDADSVDSTVIQGGFEVIPLPMEGLLSAWVHRKLQDSNEQEVAALFNGCTRLLELAERALSTNPNTDLEKLFSTVVNALHYHRDSNIDGKVLEHLAERLAGKDGLLNSPIVQSDSSSLQKLEELTRMVVDRLYVYKATQELAMNSADINKEIANSVGSIHHSNNFSNMFNYLGKDREELSKYDEFASYRLADVAKAMTVAKMTDGVVSFLRATFEQQHQDSNGFDNAVAQLEKMSVGHGPIPGRLRALKAVAESDSDRMNLGFARAIVESIRGLSATSGVPLVAITQKSSDKLVALASFISKNDYGGLFDEVNVALEEINWDPSHTSKELLLKSVGPFKYFGNLPQVNMLQRWFDEAVNTERDGIIGTMQGFIQQVPADYERFIEQVLSMHYDYHSRVQNMSAKDRESHGMEERQLINEAVRRSSKDDIAMMRRVFNSNGFKSVTKILSSIEKQSVSTLPSDLLASLNIWTKAVTGSTVPPLGNPSRMDKFMMEKKVLSALGLQYNPQSKCYYQVSKPLSTKVADLLQSSFFPLTSNDAVESITVLEKTHDIPHGLLRDIRRAKFYVGGEEMPSEVSGKSGHYADRELVEILMEKLTDLGLTNAAIVAVCATMHQSSAAVMLSSSWIGAKGMFPAKMGVGLVGSSSGGVEYRLNRVPKFGGNSSEFETILEVEVKGEVRSILKQYTNADPLEDLPAFQRSFAMIPIDDIRKDHRDLYNRLEKLEAISRMRVRMEDDGTVNVIESRYEIPGMTPEIAAQVSGISSELAMM